MSVIPQRSKPSNRKAPALIVAGLLTLWGGFAFIKARTLSALRESAQPLASRSGAGDYAAFSEKVQRKRDFYQAIQGGQVERVGRLLADGRKVEERLEASQTPLMLAAKTGSVPMVRLLLSKRADVNARSSDGNSPLLFACAGGDVAVASVLLDAGADVNAADASGNSGVTRAIRGENDTLSQLIPARRQKAFAIYTLLRDRGAKIQVGEAAHFGDTARVQHLLAAEPNPKQRKTLQTNALWAAASGGQLATLQTLTAQGARLAAKGDHGVTLLDGAAQNGQTAIVAYLLDQGANPNAAMDGGWSPLLTAAAARHTDTVRLLLKRGADVRHRSGGGGKDDPTALTFARQNHDAATIAALQEAGATE